MSGNFGLFETLPVQNWRSSVAGQDAALLHDDTLQQIIRLKPFTGQGYRLIHRPPAVHAEMIAMQDRGHLDAAMAADPIEVVLVALILTPERTIEPEARLDRGMAHHMVSLPDQGCRMFTGIFHQNPPFRSAG